MSAERELIVDNKQRYYPDLKEGDIIRIIGTIVNGEGLFFFYGFIQALDGRYFRLQKVSGGEIFPHKETGIFFAERIARVGTRQHEIIVELISQNLHLNNTMQIIKAKLEEVKRSFNNIKVGLVKLSR